TRAASVAGILSPRIGGLGASGRRTARGTRRPAEANQTNEQPPGATHTHQSNTAGAAAPAGRNEVRMDQRVKVMHALLCPGASGLWYYTPNESPTRLPDRGAGAAAD